MHLSMHNWMRAEPIEVTHRPAGQVRLLEHRDQRRAGASTTPSTSGGCSTSRSRLLGRGDADARASATWSPRTRHSGRPRSSTSRTASRWSRSSRARRSPSCPATVGKIIPDATPEEEWEWAVDGHEGDLWLTPTSRASSSRSSRSTASRPTSSTAASRQWRWPRPTGPDCGVCLDAFHINIEEADSARRSSTVGDRAHRLPRRREQPDAAGHGRLRLEAEVVAILRQVGYDGALTVEFVAPIDRTPANPYPNALETQPGRHLPRAAASSSRTTGARRLSRGVLRLDGQSRPAHTCCR